MSGKSNFKIRAKLHQKLRNWCHRAVVEAYQKMKDKALLDKEQEEEDISKALFEEIEELPFVKAKQITVIPEFRLYGKKYSATDTKAKAADRIDFRFVKWSFRREINYYAEAKNLSFKTWHKASTGAKVDGSYYRGRYIDTGIEKLLTGAYALLDGFLIGYVVNGSVQNNVIALNTLIQKRHLPPKIGLLEIHSPISGYGACYLSKNQKGSEGVVLAHILLAFD